MAEIPNDLIAQLQTALAALAQTQANLGHGAEDETAMAFDDLLAASYQIVEAADQLPGLRPAA